MNNRADFEAEISASPYEKSIERWPSDPLKYAWPGNYKDINVNFAWHMWKTSRKLAFDEALKECQKLLISGEPKIIFWDEYENGAEQGYKDCIKAISAIANKTKGRDDGLAAN